MSVFRSVDPATGKPRGEVPELSRDSLRERLEAAGAAAREWAITSFADRANLLRRVAERLRAERTAHAECMAREMGKPLAQGESEADKCAWACEAFAETAEAGLRPEPVNTDAARSEVRFDPLGPILGVMPWNFPFWQVIRFGAPALMAGNPILVKPAECVPRCAEALVDVFARAGAPAGLVQNLLVPVDAVEAVIAHPAVRAVTFTGSTAAGAAVAALAGAHAKKSVLELGGSDPFVVFDDVDVQAVTREAARARTANSGQSCIAAKRFIVLDRVVEDFTEALARRLESLRVGPPLDRATEVGPLAREDLRERLDAQVQASLSAGARRVTGGRSLPGPGWFYAPTLLADVRPEMPVAREETFGPVVAVLAARSDREAIDLANATSYGLGASLWSGDPERAERWVPAVEAGNVFVNAVVRSDPRLPFGGVKGSGYGRELGVFGLREFVNVKAVWVEELGGAGPALRR